MNYNENYEKLFFNYSLEKPQYLTKTKDGFFTNKDLDNCAGLARKFYDKFKEPPGKEQLKLLIDNSRHAGKISHSIVDAIFNTSKNDYDETWLNQTAEGWIKWRNFDDSLLDGVEFVKTAKVSPDNVDITINKFREIINTRNNLNFNKSLGLDFFNPKDHYQKLEDKMKSGKLFLDNLTGGLGPSGLIVYAGASNVGKSIWLANDAVAFTKMGHNTAVITLEMDSHKILKRIGANMLDISMSDYDDKSKDVNLISKKLKTVGMGGLTPPGKLFIEKFPTSQATVLDIENYLLDLQDTVGIKLKTVIIDYINIISNYRNPNSENTYMKIKQLAEDLRGMADKHGWLIITATQLKRSAFDVSDFNLEDIAESSGLVHTADLILGIIQDSIMHADREYWLKILKIRDGEGKNSKCRFNINYEYMRLQETDEVRIPGL